MPKPLRVEFAGAIYHLMNRGDRREPIFLDDEDRKSFLNTLGEACEKTGWQVHAYCLMDNHFHLVAEDAPAQSRRGQEVDARHLHRALQPASPVFWPSVQRTVQVGGH